MSVNPADQDQLSPRPLIEALEQRRLLAAFQALDADAFVDSLAVNIRLADSGTPYDTRFGDVKDRLLELGVRHVRNVAPQGTPTFGSNPNRWGEYINRLNELGDEGIKSALTFNKRSGGAPDFGAIDDMLGRIEAHMQDSVEAVIGLNEYDINAPQAQLDDGSWVDVWKDYQQDLFNAVNASSSAWVRDLDIVAGPTAFPVNIDDLGDVSDRVDVGSTHYYTKARPEDNFRLDRTLTKAPGAFGSDTPIYLTEGGYNYATLHPNGVSHTAGGKYVPRYLLTNYLDGIDRSYIFELWPRQDRGLAVREDNFGLVNFDGSRNAHFYAVKNLAELLGEATWDGTDWVRPTFAPATLNFSLSGDIDDVQQALFQKSDGTFYLVLWQDDTVYDNQATPSDPPLGDISNPSADVTVNFHQDIDRVRRYSNLDQSNGANVDQTATNPGGSFDVSVPDEVVVLEIDTGDSRRVQPEFGEEVVGTDWRVLDSNDGSFQYVGTINGTGNHFNNVDSADRLAYTVANVPGGQHPLTVRGDVSSQGSGKRGENNSFWLRVNGEDGDPWELISLKVNEGGFFTQTFNTSFALTSGDNLIEIAQREDGTRIDWIEFEPVARVLAAKPGGFAAVNPWPFGLKGQAGRVNIDGLFAESPLAASTMLDDDDILR